MAVKQDGKKEARSISVTSHSEFKFGEKDAEAESHDPFSFRCSEECAESQKEPDSAWDFSGSSTHASRRGLSSPAKRLAHEEIDSYQTAQRASSQIPPPASAAVSSSSFIGEHGQVIERSPSPQHQFLAR